MLVGFDHGCDDCDGIEVCSRAAQRCAWGVHTALGGAGHTSRTPAPCPQEFHAPWRIRALLPYLWRACRDLEVQAEFLLLGESTPAKDAPVHEVRGLCSTRPGAVKTAWTLQLWLPAGTASCCARCCHSSMQAEADDPAPVAEVLSLLAASMGAGTPLRRLAVRLDSCDRTGAYFVLPSGCLVEAERLLEPEAVACAAGQGLAVQEWTSEGDWGGACVLLTSSAAPPAAPADPPAAAPHGEAGAEAAAGAAPS